MVKIWVIKYALFALSLLVEIASLQSPVRGVGVNKKLSNVLQTKYTDIIPVFHNVDDIHIDSILQAVSNCYDMEKISVSLRHTNALNSLKTITNRNKANGSPIRIGASTISSIEQLLTCFEYNVDFISTMVFNREITQLCAERGVPSLCGVHTLQEAQEAITLGATSLKFYPAREIPPHSLQSIIAQLNCHRRNNNIKYFVAGGITECDIEGYKEAGADGFAVGFDCANENMENIILKLKNFNEFSNKFKV